MFLVAMRSNVRTTILLVLVGSLRRCLNTQHSAWWLSVQTASVVIASVVIASKGPRSINAQKIMQNLYTYIYINPYHTTIFFLS